MTETDDRTLAAQHADSLIADIRNRTEQGAPFGWLDPESGEPLDEWQEDCVSVAAIDYLGDALDIRYIVNNDRSYRAAQVCISLGGPNVWIDTDDKELQVYWDGRSIRSLPSAFVEAIDEALSELWEMGA
ncbi:hypothetical protein G7068_16280 [Leucobacter viscericola]|uniref:Uncharacterized protein n=1 Tax=Leucobacter viscericola TaxID=2714935 RepID=A0A6G7XJ56_9MICO|nr:hypothetical protein [Leucobacter viscericola]QIK64533.1 hypothetical protein G7068_15920 [Leucobacter viscericola]QIK64605.1 hypothetical protein G7068_16280 [Leucobacter viscericola]